MSDWGAHALRRELFGEELVFLLANLETVVRLDDPEVVPSRRSPSPLLRLSCACGRRHAPRDHSVARPSSCRAPVAAATRRAITASPAHPPVVRPCGTLVETLVKTPYAALLSFRPWSPHTAR